MTNRPSDPGTYDALPAAPGHTEPFGQGFIVGMVLVLGVVLGLGSLLALFVRDLDLVDLWAPGSLLRIVGVGFVVGTVFGVIFATPTSGTGLKPTDPVGAFNGGVEWFRIGDYQRAAEAFAAVCDDPAASESLRLSSGYARVVSDRKRGLPPTAPRAFARRTDEMAVQYALYCAAGLLADQGISVGRPKESAILARVERDGAPLFYRIFYRDAMGTLATVVTRTEGDGSTVHLEMEPDPNPQPQDQVILDVAMRAGSGAHEPVRLPTRWASLALPTK